MSEREELIKKLKEILGHEKIYDPEAEVIADFIIADRKRIVEPLVKVNNKTCLAFEWEDAGREALKLAGLE